MTKETGRPTRPRRKRTGTHVVAATRARRSETGFVSFVGAGPGDPDLITLRGWRALQNAELVLHDSLVDRRLLADLAGRCVFVGKRCGRHSMTQEQINDLLVESALAGLRVVRLKGGDPAVLGRLGEEALALAERNIAFDIVPGVSSATAVPELAGIPVTHRGIADSFVVATAHRRSPEEGLSIPPYAPGTTLVLLMARANAEIWTDELRAAGYPDLLPVGLVSSGCTAGQRVVVTSVANAMRDLAASELATPVLAIVGRVVGLRSRLGGAERFEGFQNARGARLEHDRRLAADFVGGTEGEEEEHVVEVAS
jgi:uroporphyrin-III C-methyltransferase